MANKLFEWTDDLKVKIKTLDDDHKKLVDYINELHVAMVTGRSNEVWIPILSNLVVYTKNHFSKEEKLFETYKYPDAIAHKGEHDVFVQKIIEFQKDVEIKKIGLSMKLMNFLKDWLRKHIMGRDQMYSSFLNEKGIH